MKYLMLYLDRNRCLFTLPVPYLLNPPGIALWLIRLSIHPTARFSGMNLGISVITLQVTALRPQGDGPAWQCGQCWWGHSGRMGCLHRDRRVGAGGWRIRDRGLGIGCSGGNCSVVGRVFCHGLIRSIEKRLSEAAFLYRCVSLVTLGSIQSEVPGLLTGALDVEADLSWILGSRPRYGGRLLQ